MQPDAIGSTTSNYNVHRMLALCAAISGAAAVIQLTFIIIFYAGIGIFGPLNDLAYTLQLIFTLPIVLFLSQRSHRGSPGQRLALTMLGSVSCGSAIALQLLLIFGVLGFFEMIGWLLAAIALLVVWFALIGRSQDNLAPAGLGLSILAGLSFGYPIWAYRLRRNLLVKANPAANLEMEAIL